MTIDIASRFRPWLLLAAFSLLLFLITASTYGSLGVVLPAMIGELNWSFEKAFLGFSVLGVFTGASSWLPAILIRRIGVRGTLLVGAVVLAGGFVGLANAESLLSYYVGAAACGVGFQMAALIPGTHVLSSLFRQRALPFGVYFTFGSLGGAAGPWMVLTLMEASGGDWRAFWMVQGVLAAIVGGGCALMVGGSKWLAAAALEVDEEVEQAARQAPANARVYRTAHEWTVRQALRTPQFYILVAAYFSHLLVGVTVASVSVSHLTEIGVAAGVAAVAAGALAAKMLSLEALMQTLARLAGGALGDRVDPRWLLVFAQAMLVIGLLALAKAATPALMLVYAIGTGVGFGLTVLAVTVLLLNYYGRQSNLELFSLTCLVGAVSAAGPFIAGAMRDRLGSFTPTFELFAAVTAVVFVAVLAMRPPRAPIA
ncbi:MFS transporter [Caulobacter vibrioides]|uniref:MFS transporter n=1 Tax=Caulobacter vibrioides TaxID=155892 RepID=A0A290MU70_CAUVI|nr:MFS transporter [Caulobacter vibrioides]ATC31150.1 MFS transporter [Caulobacter vibrioides]